MSDAKVIFETGELTAKLISLVDDETISCLPPPKPLLVATPCEEGKYPVLVFLHGYLLYNSFYSQLLQHVASHGFIVVAPQLYSVAGPDCEDEIKFAAAVVDWLADGLSGALPVHVQPNLGKLGLAGHSRGGKVAFALAQGHVRMNSNVSVLVGVDPVDGMDKEKQTNPPVLTYVPNSFHLKMATLVIGSGLGQLKKNPLFPPCAPKGVNHQDFFDECCPPAYHFVVKHYGHLDMLDDDTRGFRGKATYCLCKNGESRKPMRLFVGGVIVAFMKAFLQGDTKFFVALRQNPEISPAEISIAALEEPIHNETAT